MLYDRQETVADYLSDDACVDVLQDLISWVGASPLLSRIADTRRVFLAVSAPSTPKKQQILSVAENSPVPIPSQKGGLDMSDVVSPGSPS